MHRRRTLIAALALSAACLGLQATGAQGTAPGRDGRIAYYRYRLQNDPLWSEIYVTNVDGSGAHKVSHAPDGFQDEAPDWAPDGSRIAFQRCPPGNGRCTVWTTKPDGSGETQLTPPCPPGKSVPACPDDTSPAFSPNGREIAVSRYGLPPLRGLVVADTNLRHPRLVYGFHGAAGAPDISSPTWAPNGRRLAFIVYNDNGRRWKPVNGWAIFVVGVDGSGLHRITSWRVSPPGTEATGKIDWSPDGARILFRSGTGSDAGRGEGNLFTVEPDGTGLRRLTNFGQFGGVLRAGSYSPDGQSILFATDLGASAPARDLPDVFVMRADGTDIRPVTRAPNWDADPDWGTG